MQRKIVLSMKKYLFISLFALVAIMFTGCEKNDAVSRKMTIDFRVPQSVWTYNEDYGGFSAIYDAPQLTANVYDYGTWTMSHEYGVDSKDPFLVQLPEIVYLYDEGTNTYYSQRIDYEVHIGYVRVVVTNSDYAYLNNWKPEEMYFHLQIVY